MSDNITYQSKWVTEIIPILIEGYKIKIPFSGLSMYPLIAGNRDQVVIEAISDRKLKRGDIVLYVRRDGTHVLHRIHHIKGQSYYMLGDAQTSIEGPIESDMLIARAESLIRKGKTISCNRLDYKIIIEIWLLLRPFRTTVIRLVSKLRKKIKNRKHNLCKKDGSL